jgi:hypothetical protein
MTMPAKRQILVVDGRKVSVITRIATLYERNRRNHPEQTERQALAEAETTYLRYRNTEENSRRRSKWEDTPSKPGEMSREDIAANIELAKKIFGG